MIYNTKMASSKKKLMKTLKKYLIPYNKQKLTTHVSRKKIFSKTVRELWRQTNGYAQ